MLHLNYKRRLEAEHVEYDVDGERGQDHSGSAQNQIGLVVLALRVGARVASRRNGHLLYPARLLNGHAAPARGYVRYAAVNYGLLRNFRQEKGGVMDAVGSRNKIVLVAQ